MEALAKYVETLDGCRTTCHVLGASCPFRQMAGNTSREYIEMMEATASDENMFIDRYIAEGIKLRLFLDGCRMVSNNGRWVNVGTWEVDTKRFPKGIAKLERSCPL